MKNYEIIANAIVENGYGTAEMVEKTLAKGKRLPFMTAKEWNRNGYLVKAGEKAAFKVRLWVKSDEKDEDGNLINNGYILKYCSIFTPKQVESIKDSQKAKAEEPKEEPKTEEKPKKVTRKAKAKKTEKVIEKKTEKEPKKAKAKKTESPKKTRKAKTEKVAKATLKSEKTKKSTFETWADPENPNVHYVKYEKKSKKASRKAEPKLVKEVKKAEPKKAKAEPKKAEKKLVKAPTMVRKDFVKDGIKMVSFECSDGTRGFTMPLNKYEETTKTFRKLWGII
jgi:hypothetical protein